MIHFESDYLEGAHENILKRMQESNLMQTCGYGMDEICESARKRIQKAIGNSKADVHFLVGGTQTNLIVIDAILRPYQGVISAESGHINVHETGAVEACGHKVISLKSEDGTISGNQVKEVMENHLHDSNKEHTVQPAMVYISFPTENGTLYSKKQLKDLYQVCTHYHLPLFIDGARLGYGLMSEKNDITLKELSKLCDVFYIGGTKVGALFGEAVVITKDALKKDFRYMIKQRGGMLAKGRMLGIQFDELFKDDLYFKISKHAIEMAMQIKQACIEASIPFAYESFTNQQFLLLSDTQYKKLSSKFVVSDFGKKNDMNIIRICTSWATTQNNTDALIEMLKTI